MKIKRPKRYYKVEYASDTNRLYYAVQVIADCLTLESAKIACKEAVQIHGWNSGTIFIVLTETGTNRMIERILIDVEAIRLKLEGEQNE